MPQMAPIWWSTLFMIFIITFMIMMMLMYFFNIYSPMTIQKNQNKEILNINWKW